MSENVLLQATLHSSLVYVVQIVSEKTVKNGLNAGCQSGGRLLLGLVTSLSVEVST